MPKILVVDDSRMIRDLVIFTLNEGGYSDIDEADDGLVGVSRVEQNKYDLIITDVNMPNMDGFEFTLKAKSMENAANTPILILTTESSKEMKQKGKACGAIGWITKPFVPNELIEAVSVVLSRFDGRA